MTDQTPPRDVREDIQRELAERGQVAGRDFEDVMNEAANWRSEFENAKQQAAETPSADTAEALAFMQRMLPDTDGYVFLGSDNQPETQWNQARFKAGDWDRIATYIARQVENHRHVWFCGSVFEGTDRGKIEPATVQAAWTDLDRGVDAAERQELANAGFTLNESGSPGRLHVWAPLAEPVDHETARELSKALGEELGGDMGKYGHESFLRVPGTKNVKSFAGDVRTIHEGGRWTPEALRGWLSEREAVATATTDDNDLTAKLGIFEDSGARTLADSDEPIYEGGGEIDGIAYEGRDGALYRLACSLVTRMELADAQERFEQRANACVPAFPEAEAKFWNAYRYLEQEGSLYVEHDDEPQADDNIVTRNADNRVVWRELLSKPLPPPDWLWEPFIERGKATALVAGGKDGKSLLVQEAACAMATGRQSFGVKGAERRRVLYIDMENADRDLQERVLNFGYGSDDGLDDGLFYYQFPSIGYLNTEKGGNELLELAEHHDADLVVIDTLSRVVEGEENDSTTYRGFYDHAGRPLKRAKRAVLRLDHTGHAGSHARGSSAKNDDVDDVWTMKSSGDFLNLERTHSRSGHGRGKLTVRRQDIPRLHHEEWTPLSENESDPVERRMSVLDDMDFNGNQRGAVQVLKHHGVKQREAREAYNRRNEARSLPNEVETSLRNEE